MFSMGSIDPSRISQKQEPLHKANKKGDHQM